MATRWGIVSASKISHDFVTALKLSPSEEHQVVAVAARSLDNAQKFAKQFDIPRAYGSYEELAQDKGIDIAYISTIHPVHFSLCKLFLNAGCNILCEKPMTMNAKEAKEIIHLAKEKGLFFMEGFWSRFFPIYEDLRQELAAGCIGKPMHVTANFGNNVIDAVPRCEAKELGGGCLLDMGCYPIQFVQMIYNHEMPKKITAAGILNKKTGVDEVVTAIFEYSEGQIAVINTTLTSTIDQRAVISGSKRMKTENVITVENMWCPTTLVTPHKTYNRPVLETSSQFNFLNSQGMVYEAQSVRDCLLKGLKENPLMTHDQSLQIQVIMDEIRRQLGIVFDADNQ